VPGLKTNEREGTRAVLRYAHVSAFKVREVLDLVRNKPVDEADDILRFVERDAALLVGKLLRSAVANAVHNDQMSAEELYVSACYADEGVTAKRWRPRARGRATRIRKRTAHITLIVSRLPEDRLARVVARRRSEQVDQRNRRVAAARQSQARQQSEATGRNRAERRHGGAPVEGEETVTEATEATSTEATTAELEEARNEVAEANEEQAAEAAPVTDAEEAAVEAVASGEPEAAAEAVETAQEAAGDTETESE
jgi:large subunit ribosomal protein L22